MLNSFRHDSNSSTNDSIFLISDLLVPLHNVKKEEKEEPEEPSITSFCIWCCFHNCFKKK